MTIKDYLKVKKIPQVALAKELKTNTSSVNLWVNGWRPLPTEYKEPIAKFLDVSVEEIERNNIAYVLTRVSHNLRTGTEG